MIDTSEQAVFGLNPIYPRRSYKCPICGATYWANEEDEHEVQHPTMPPPRRDSFPYILAMDYRDANRVIEQGEEFIGLFSSYAENRYINTWYNALLLNDGHQLVDINLTTIRWKASKRKFFSVLPDIQYMFNSIIEYTRKKIYGNTPAKDFNQNKQRNAIVRLYTSVIDEVTRYKWVEILASSEPMFYNVYLIDELFEEAAHLIVKTQQCSISLLQHKLKLGYNRAQRIMDQLEVVGIVSYNVGDMYHKANISTELSLQQHLKDLNGGLQIVCIETAFEKFLQENRIEIEQQRSEYLRRQQDAKDQMEKDTIKVQLLERERKRRLNEEARNELIEKGELFNSYNRTHGIREPIAQDVMDKVWNRDGGKCVKCGSNENLEFDHIIPFSKGGSATYRNIQILCKRCNIQKSNKIG